MATPQDLDRLRALLGQLAALGGARRGELIRAEDWNLLVGALADVARAVLATDTQAAVPMHEHVDQVADAWLTPALRDLLQRGPLADPAMQQRLTAIEQTLRRLEAGNDGQRSGLDEFRSRLTDVASRDLERQSALTTLRRQLDAVADPRPELQAVRNALGAVQKDLGTVQRAAASLTVNNQVLDAGALLGRIGELEAVRERLRLANGELLDAATIERRLAEVTTRTVNRDQLQQALDGHVFQLSTEQTLSLEDRIGTRLLETTNGRLDGFRSEVDTRVTTRLDDIGGLVQGRVADALPGLEAALEATLGDRIEVARGAAIDAAQQAAQRAIDTSAATLRGDVDRRLGGLQTELGSLLQAQVTRSVAEGLASLDSRLQGASSRLDGLGSRIAALADTQAAQTGRLARLPQELASLRSELKTALQDEIGLQIGNVTRQVDSRLTAFARDNDLKLSAMRGDIANQALDAARNAAIEASQGSAAALRTQLLAEMRAVAREESSVVVSDNVRRTVDAAVAQHVATLPNLISAEVRRQQLVRPDTTRLVGAGGLAINNTPVVRGGGPG